MKMDYCLWIIKLTQILILSGYSYLSSICKFSQVARLQQKTPQTLSIKKKKIYYELDGRLRNCSN